MTTPTEGTPAGNLPPGGVHAEDLLLAVMHDADEPKPGNPIHSTDGARDFGFRAALVGGVTVYGWTVRTIVRALGDRWLHDGWAHLRFRKPVYPGDALRVRVLASGAFEIARLNSVGIQGAVGSEGTGGVDGAASAVAEPCIDGEVGLGTASWLAALQWPNNLRPSQRAADAPRLVPAIVPIGRSLAARATTLTAAEAITFAIEKERETDPRFVGAQPLAHPAWLATQPIQLLHHSFDYGPAIHAESHIQHLAPAPVDAQWIVAGNCVDAYERKGHHSMVNDCLLQADGRDVARIRHTVIYQVARRGA